ncbi:phospho-sugar mutase [Iamia sp. SCSIO 61187]|uniref:phospho-sugar mutase n=1 Tax=Iamia sp. SCSIO 61187 TaxID=2722752 RepID=UPI001C624F7F|nr:phospho-sugar mutase [Iamia sp. SCSIO 61187]QYG93758.1 phospho-sugar mutase [Iamia sp. SCSIO 61187]
MTATDESTEALVARVKAWIDDDPEPGTAGHLRQLWYDVEDAEPDKAAAAEAELRELFRTHLEFGTAGLRGPVGAGPNRMNRAVVRRAAAGIAAWIRAAGTAEHGVVVARDARHRSDDFVADTIEVVAGAGIPVHVLPAPIPTPVLAYAVRHIGVAAGIMVTASHNPAPDNGYKVYDGEGRQIDATQAAAIAEAMAAAGPLARLPISGASNPIIQHHGLEMVDAYLDAIGRVVKPKEGRAPVQVAYTQLHGVGGPVVRRAAHQSGFITLHEVTEQAEADPDFPTVSFPNPEERGALDHLVRTAAFVGAEVAFANDPDADRLAMAVVDPKVGANRDAGAWTPLSGDQLGWLLADHLVRRGDLPEGGVFATTIVSSTLLREIALAAGRGYVETLTGFKWLSRAGTPEHPLILAYEEALGYCIGDTVRDKDGISALLLASEMISDLVEQGLTVWDRLDDLARRFGLHLTGQWSVRLEGGDGAERIAEAMARLRATPPTMIGSRAVAGVSDLAEGAPARGLPPADVVGLALPGARVVVRPSGTEPKLKCYVEVVEAVPPGTDVAGARARAREGLTEITAALPAVLGLD